MPRITDSHPYAYLDRRIREATGSEAGFGALIAPGPRAISQSTVEGFKRRYATIASFHRISLDLLIRSLAGELPPSIAELMLAELPAHLGREYHARLTSAHLRPPVHFRTDEVGPGTIVEVQCPGSLWGEYELLRELYADDGLGDLPPSLAAGFADGLTRYTGIAPTIQHLLDNASRPHTMRFFIQMTRPTLRYWEYDSNVRQRECTFIRSHSFQGLVAQDFHYLHLERCQRGEVWFDLPPVGIFEQKLLMALPFEADTARYYTDDIRAIFPVTRLVRQSGIPLDDGSYASPATIASKPRRQRELFLKYAGPDTRINWGSQGVYFLGMQTRTSCLALLSTAMDDAARGRPWVVQQAVNETSLADYITRVGAVETQRAHAKWSGFYGPAGLLGILTMHRDFWKVHGAEETVLGLAQF